MEELNTEILDLLSHAAYVKNNQDLLCYINPVAEELTGYSNKEAELMPVNTVFGPVEQYSHSFTSPSIYISNEKGRVIEAGIASISSLDLPSGRFSLVLLQPWSTPSSDQVAKRREPDHNESCADALFEDGPVVRYKLEITSELQVVSVSKNIKQFGYDAKRIVNGDIPFSQIFRCPEIAKLSRLGDKQIHQLHTLTDQECMLVTALGQKVWVYHHARIFRKDDISEVYGYFIDIRKRKEIERRYEENHARYLDAQRYARLGHWEYFPEKDLISASSEACEIYGYSQGDLYNYIPAERLRKLIHPDDRKKVVAAFRDAGKRKGKTYLSIEHRTLSSEGHFLYLITRGTVEKDDQGNIVKFFGTVQDITEIKRASENVRQSRDMLNKIINTIPQAVFWKDLNGVFLGCNNVFASTFGFRTPAGLVGLTDFDINMPRDMAEAYRGVDKKVVSTGEPVEMIEQVHTSEGELRWVDTSKSPLTDERGNIIGVLGVFDDITERKQLEEALEKRILSLTTPLESNEKICFDDLFSLDEIQKFQDVFSQATGVGCMIVDPDGVPITKPSNTTDLCFDLIRSTEKGAVHCKMTDAIMAQHQCVGPNITLCPVVGCWLAGANITVGEKHLASWIIGQVRSDTPIDAQIERYAVEIGADPAKMLREYRQIPVMSEEQFESVSQALDLFTNYMSRLAYQNVNQARYITSKKKSEKELAEKRDALAESNLKLALALDLAKMGHWEGVLNEKGEGYFLFNDQFYSLYATNSQREGSKMSVHDYTVNFVHPDDRYLVEESIRAFLSVKTSDFYHTTEHRIITRNNEIRHIAVKFKRVKTNQQNEFKLTGVNQDITERKKIEETLLQAKKDAEQANKTKSAFLANMSHEIRTPINGIMGMLQMMQDSSPKPEHHEYIEIAIQSCRRLTRLLSDILDISRVEAGKMLIQEETFDLSENIAALTQLFLPTAKSKGLKLTICKNTDVPDNLIGDVVRFQQVLSNLIGNAIKFTIKGEVLVTIEKLDMAVNTKDVRLFITVKDNGIGISDSTLKKLFTPFTQEEVRYKHQFGGAGLGLAISKQLVELMGGNLAVNSREEEGTSFYISLPFKLQQEKDNISEKNENESLSRKYKVLFAEDDPVSRMVGAQLLRNIGLNVTAVINGAEVVECLTKENFDLVVLDIQMPVVDGLEATKAVRKGRAGEKNRLIPIIAMTAYAMADDEREFYEAGMNGYIRKPVEKNSILQEISRVMARGSRKKKNGN